MKYVMIFVTLAAARTKLAYEFVKEHEEFLSSSPYVSKTLQAMSRQVLIPLAGRLVHH